MKKNIVAFLFIALPLLTGEVLYAAYRSDSIYLNQFLETTSNGLLSEFLQSLSETINLPHWVIYSLPDGLWMLALVVLVLAIWDFKLDMRSLPWLAIAVLSGVMFEMFQGLAILSGTFDVTDLILILVSAFIPISYVFLKVSLCKNL